MFKYLIFLFTFLSLSLSLRAEILTTQHSNAVCNNGEQATYSYFKNDSENWFIYFWGGGVAPNEKSYLDRQDKWKVPTKSSEEVKDHIVKDFVDNKYNVIVIHYCTSDLYQGMHINKINNENIYYHGRYIVEDIFNKFDKRFNSANKLVFAGHSAGALALGFNVDLISKYKDPYIIPDSFYLDEESLKVRLTLKGGFWDGVENFVYNNRLDYCKDSHWANCMPSRSLFDRYNLNNIFFIWNIGDPYIKGDIVNVKKSIISDVNYYKAGFSVNAEKMNLKAFEEWGHVMTANDLYYKKFDGISLQELIWNWINNSGQSNYINHN